MSALARGACTVQQVTCFACFAAPFAAMGLDERATVKRLIPFVAVKRSLPDNSMRWMQ
jgi:hypothetical protein